MLLLTSVLLAGALGGGAARAQEAECADACECDCAADSDDDAVDLEDEWPEFGVPDLDAPPFAPAVKFSPG
jgi:hypothetical protein